MSTIKEIAQKAGVSPTTVANVIHGKHERVSDETLLRVKKVIQENKYAPNMGALILAHKHSRIIGVIMFMEPRWNETVLEDPFSSAILGAMEQEVRNNGYYVMLHTTSDEDEVVRLAKAWKLAGLILVWVPSSICRLIKDTIDTPIVFIDSYFTDNEHIYHNIGLQDEQGGYEIARYMISMGHIDIVFLANDSFYAGATDAIRFKGCQRAFKEVGLPLDSHCYVPLPKERDERYQMYENLGSPQSPYTALVFSADYYAAEAVTLLQDSGIDVPGEISVTGFDDNIFARLVRPHLTTVHQDSGEKGRRAIQMVMKLIHNKEVPIANVQLDVALEIRDSVKRIRET